MKVAEKMEDKVKGAWIIHHCRKIQGVQQAASMYEQIDFAGKCGLLLSAISGSDEITISRRRMEALAKAAGISRRSEMPTILDELQRQRIIDRSDEEIVVLGLTTPSILEKTTTIFSESEPGSGEQAVIELSETVSGLPLRKKGAEQYVSDMFSLSSSKSREVLKDGEEIGFFDHESVGRDKVYFNGNLFRRENIRKVNAVLASLTAGEQRRLNELNATLDESGCISLGDADAIASRPLLSKLRAIGLVDVNTIGNEKGRFSFVTKPAAFSKFTNTIADDAFDLAKVFVTSLTYGMTQSASSRGRITMITALMRKLIQGQWVGPATAIGQDYQVLELKGVIEVKPFRGSRFKMRLLKKDVGQLALSVITQGEASSESVLKLPSVAASVYTGPEANRTLLRKRQSGSIKLSVAHLLNDLRTGGIR